MLTPNRSSFELSANQSFVEIKEYIFFFLFLKLFKIRLNGDEIELRVMGVEGGPAGFVMGDVWGPCCRG